MIIKIWHHSCWCARDTKTRKNTVRPLCLLDLAVSCWIFLRACFLLIQKKLGHFSLTTSGITQRILWLCSQWICISGYKWVVGQFTFRGSSKFHGAHWFIRCFPYPKAILLCDSLNPSIISLTLQKVLVILTDRDKNEYGQKVLKSLNLMHKTPPIFTG